MRVIKNGINAGIVVGILLTTSFNRFVFAQNDSSSFFTNSQYLNSHRLFSVATTEALTFTGIMTGLNQLWYKSYPKSSFHFFNDNKEWLQMDKFGHATTAFHMGYIGLNLMKWSGVPDKKSWWYGGTLGFLFLTSVEAFDGFSSEWGASPGDLIANASGTTFLLMQYYLWDELRLSLKFSAHPSNYAQYRPEILGSTFSERMLKDYNGQTYWISANIRSFLHAGSKFPSWLNLAIGYSGEEMLKGNTSHYVIIGPDNTSTYFNSYRQYFISFDIDLHHIIRKPGIMKSLLGTFAVIKIPAPAIEFNKRDGIRLRAIYF